MDNNLEEKTLNVKEFIESHKLTKKAEFLYTNGFCNEATQVEKLDGFKDVTFQNGFKGFNVYLSNDNKLFIAKAEAEEGNVYSYHLIELEEVTDEEFEYLVKAKKEINKINLGSIMKITSLVVSFLGAVCLIIFVATLLIAGTSLVETFIYATENIILLAVSFGVSALLFKKK